LYGFVGKDIAVVAHALTKGAKVPARDIDLAAIRLARASQSPQKFTATRDVINGQEDN
jgi:hypothetical protein